MKTLIVFVSSIVLLSSGNVAFADEISIFHTKLETINRARMKRSFQQGRVEYYYNQIRKYQEKYPMMNERAGNIETSAKHAYNYTVMTDPLVRTYRKDFKVGTVKAKGENQQIVNIVEVRGNIKSRHSVEIGTVRLSEGSGDVINITTIHGSIYVQ